MGIQDQEAKQHKRSAQKSMRNCKLEESLKRRNSIRNKNREIIADKSFL